VGSFDFEISSLTVTYDTPGKSDQSKPRTSR